MRRILTVLLAGVLGGSILPAQEPDDKTPLFRVNSERVIIEFLALSKRGRFVDDLTLDEIEVEIDGKKQKLLHLLPPMPGDQAAADGSAMSSAREVDPQAPDDPAFRRQLSKRTVILLDSRTIDAANFYRSVVAIKGFIGQSLEADHFVMLAEIDRKLNVVAPFTQDRGVLLKAVNSLQPGTLFNPTGTSRASGIPDAGYIDELLEQMHYLRNGMRELVHAVSSHPGRKHVVFFSEGYPMNPLKDIEFFARSAVASSRNSQTRMNASRNAAVAKDPQVKETIEEIVSLSNAYGISFYTVDARGLVGVPGIGAYNPSDPNSESPSIFSQVEGRTNTDELFVDVAERFRTITGDGAEGDIPVQLFDTTRIDDITDSQDALVALAAGTNGSAFYNSNDLGAVLVASTAEQSHVYLAAVEPKKLRKGKDRFHKIKVKTTRQDVLIRSQKGFVDFSTRDLARARLAFAFQSPARFQGLRPIAEVQRKGDKMEAVFGISGGQISSDMTRDGRRVELVFLG
ncbi:MAG TPA: VWA domain-containing protein, partial [Acidobacteriota bacterium]|nr:VWA domain-containing protein [Acidobacteriota bacterium]